MKLSSILDNKPDIITDVRNTKHYISPGSGDLDFAASEFKTDASNQTRYSIINKKPDFQNLNSNNKSLYKVLEDIYKFRTNQEFKFDQPNYYFFKLFFYFNNDDTTNDYMNQSGLLSLTHNNFVKEAFDKYCLGIKGEIIGLNNISAHANSAINYLLLNKEYERAGYIAKFIDLLQDININTPWYFQKIEGLEEAIKRDWFESDSLKIEERKSIKLNMLEDSIDDRIGTLIDLYKAACFSDYNKKEIVPANLRKFDMGIFIVPVLTKGVNIDVYDNTYESFSNPILSRNKIEDDVGNNYVSFSTSCKYYDLINCEIGYSSGDTIASDLDNGSINTEGKKYQITIYLDDVKQNRINQFLSLSIGDYIWSDVDPNGKEPKINTGKIYQSILRDNEIFTERGKAPVTLVDINENGYLGNALNPEDTNKLSGYAGTIKQRKKGLLSNTIDRGLDELGNKIQIGLNNLLLGNMFKPTVVNKINTGLDALTADDLQQSAEKIRSLFPKKPSKHEINPNDIFPDIESDNSMESYNIYPKVKVEKHMPDPPNIFTL